MGPVGWGTPADVIRVGVSGWSYPRWRGDFYPKGLRQRDELGYAAERMTTVELNGSFYSLQRPSSYLSWRDATPEDFVLAVKGSRYVTHLKRLRDIDQALANFFASGPLLLGPKLGPFLWQLPERIEYDAGLMGRFYAALPRTTTGVAELAARHDERVPEDRAHTTTDAERPVRHVLEARHPSFAEPEALAQLREHGIGCVIADTAGRFPRLDAVTSETVYVRLHGETRLYYGGYSPDSLDRWAERCREWAESPGVSDVLVYFDNDADGRAPYDAVALLERVGRVGLEPTTQGL
ncbi:DUF72 domain-containing protein [Nocardioides ultimimeridianus]